MLLLLGSKLPSININAHGKALLGHMMQFKEAGRGVDLYTVEGFSNASFERLPYDLEQCNGFALSMSLSRAISWYL